jgi:hypothetical protein
MAVDYAAVYRPMAAMITPPGRAHDSQFRSYHSLSMWLNLTHVGLCAVAAAVLCWPMAAALCPPAAGGDVAAGTDVE